MSDSGRAGNRYARSYDFEKLDYDGYAAPRIGRVQFPHQLENRLVDGHCGLHLSKAVNDRLQRLKNFWLRQLAQEAHQLRNAGFYLLPVACRMQPYQRVAHIYTGRSSFKIALLLQRLAAGNCLAEQVTNDGLGILNEICGAFQLLQCACKQRRILQYGLDQVSNVLGAQRCGAQRFHSISHRVFADNREIGDEILGAVTNPPEMRKFLNDKVKLAIKFGNAVFHKDGAH